MPSIVFNNIPSDIRVPGIYTEIDPSLAGIYVQNHKVLIIAQSKNVIVEEPVYVTSIEWAKTTFGPGSHAAIMIENFKLNNAFSELWILPLNDAAGSTKATATTTVTGTATASGTLRAYIGGDFVDIPVSNGDTATAVAANIVTYVNTDYDLPVTATSAAGVVTYTAKNAGTISNKLTIVYNYYGTMLGEAVPSGLTIATTAMTGGATDPTLSTKLPLIGNLDVAFYVHPFNTSTSLDAFETFLATRWDPLSDDADGQGFTAIQDTVSALQTFGLTRNDPNHSILGYEQDSPAWFLQVAAAFGAQASQSLTRDPARQLATLRLIGVRGVKTAKRFSLQNRQTLLNSGISTVEYRANGAVSLERIITTYQKDPNGLLDAAYLDVMTRSVLSSLKKSVKNYLSSRYARSKLVGNNTATGGGNAVASPASIRNTLVSWYLAVERAGIVQNHQFFERNIRVTLDPDDPNRVDIQLAPFLVNNLMITAIKIQFRLKI